MPATAPLTRDPELKFDRMFEDKVALNSFYAHTGKEGEKLSKTSRGYWLSRFPGIATILEWVEAQEGNEITDAVVSSAVHVEGKFIHMTYLDMQELVTEDCAYRWQFRRRSLILTHGWLTNWRYNDICPKYFKYCQIDEQRRKSVGRKPAK